MITTLILNPEQQQSSAEYGKRLTLLMGRNREPYETFVFIQKGNSRPKFEGFGFLSICDEDDVKVVVIDPPNIDRYVRTYEYVQCFAKSVDEIINLSDSSMPNNYILIRE